MLHENGTRQKKTNPLGIPGSVRTVASSVPGLNPEETSQPQLGWAPPSLVRGRIEGMETKSHL